MNEGEIQRLSKHWHKSSKITAKTGMVITDDKTVTKTVDTMVTKTVMSLSVLLKGNCG